MHKSRLTQSSSSSSKQHDATNCFNNVWSARGRGGGNLTLNNSAQWELAFRFTSRKKTTTQKRVPVLRPHQKERTKKIKTRQLMHIAARKQQQQTTFSRGCRCAPFGTDDVMHWLPSKGVKRDAAAEQLSSLRCHSPVQCCLNMIRQGSTVKRLKAQSRALMVRHGDFFPLLLLFLLLLLLSAFTLPEAPAPALNTKIDYSRGAGKKPKKHKTGNTNGA